MAFDPLECDLLDPCNGREDLRNRILRHVGPAFWEDPLRVLRGMQFIARSIFLRIKKQLMFANPWKWRTWHQKEIFEEWKN